MGYASSIIFTQHRCSTQMHQCSRIGSESRRLADFSLALINRTGAYYVCRDIVENLSDRIAGIRYWRWQGNEPVGLKRRILGQLMLLEFHCLSGSKAFERSPPRRYADCSTLYLDPLYVLRSRLDKDDIVLCHDVGPVTHPELFDHGTTLLYQRAYDKISAAKPHLVFVSQASCDALMGLFGGRYRTLHVIPLYVREELDCVDDVKPAGINSHFLLTVGALEKRKNHERIIEAFVTSGLRERGYSYVFCGPRGNSADKVIPLSRATDGVRYLGYRSDAELRWLYRNAAGFVMPSLLEGFGLPALEAARYGLLSIVSGGGAQEEAVSGGAIMVSPHSVASIRKGLLDLVDMEEGRRRSLVDIACQQAARLTKSRFLSEWRELLGKTGPSPGGPRPGLVQGTRMAVAGRAHTHPHL